MTQIAQGHTGWENKIGLVAGYGQFPLIFSRAAARKGMRVYAVGHIQETAPELATHVEEMEWVHLGELGRILDFFTSRGVCQAVLAGGIRKTRMFRDARPDEKALALLATLHHTQDDGLLRAFADFLEAEGIRVHPSTFLLPELMAPPGCWTRRRPTAGEHADIVFGLRIARKIGRLDIGQCVVVQAGSVLAVEAIEGTDAAVRRGGGLGGGGAVVVKVSKPHQDLRFDLPAVGLQTVVTMRDVGARVLAVEAGRTLVFDREEVIRFADACAMAVVGIEDEDA